MPKVSKDLLDQLNLALSDEMASSIRYLWDHILARGLESPTISDLFKTDSMLDMRQAYALAERVHLLGGLPTTVIPPVSVGGELRSMLSEALRSEERAIEKYRGLVKRAESEDDIVTARLLEDILKETEEQARVLEKLLAAQ